MRGDMRRRWGLLTDVWQSAVKNVFIRGSVVRYVHLPANAVDIPLLEDATRRGMLQNPAVAA
jgi:U6 snRNA-associated Sm-like protein LSm2